MHLGFNGADAAAKIAELHMRMIGQERHWHARIRHSLADHQCGESYSKRIIVMARVPDRNAIGLPGLVWPDGSRSRGHLWHVAAARRPRVLNHRHWMQIGDSRFEL